MKTIIVPTDFSKNAFNALKYAVNIANHFSSTIYLVNVYETVNKTGMLLSIRDFMKKDAEKDLSKVVKQIKPYLKVGTNLEAKAIHGHPVDVLCNYAQQLKADLIVMGTQGASGIKAVFFGSNTAGVMKHTDIPLLTVPNDLKYKPFKSIVFALDSDVVTTSEVIEPLLKLVESYKAKIEVVHVEKEKELALVDAGVDIYLTDVPHRFHLLQSDDTQEAIKDFVDEYDSDLLCLIRRDRGFLGRLFRGSVTKREVFSSQIPLLILSD